jgi:hypothetical protein
MRAQVRCAAFADSISFLCMFVAAAWRRDSKRCASPANRPAIDDCATKRDAAPALDADQVIFILVRANARASVLLTRVCAAFFVPERGRPGPPVRNFASSSPE